MRYIVAIGVAGLLIVGLFLLKPLMLAVIDPTDVLTRWDRLFLSIGFLWSKFGWMAVPFIIAAAIVVAALLPKRRAGTK